MIRLILVIPVLIIEFTLIPILALLSLLLWEDVFKHHFGGQKYSAPLTAKILKLKDA